MAAKNSNAKAGTLRIAFVGQPEYFRCLYENDLNKYYEVKEFVLKWGANTKYYKDLIEFNPSVAFFFRPELYPKPLLKALKGIKVALSSEPVPKYIMGHFITSDDMKNRLNFLKGAKGKYDYFFHYDRTSIRYLQEKGFKVDGEFLFPVATGFYRPIDCKKVWDWGFFGRDTVHRNKFLGVAKRDFNGLHVAHGIYGEEFVRLINACKIGVNLHTDKNVSLEHRMQNMMACKVMVMSEPLSHNDFLKPGVHYVEFTQPEEFLEKLRYYLVNGEDRMKIGLNGFRLIQKELSATAVFPRLIRFLLNRHKPIGLFRDYNSAKPNTLEGKTNQVPESLDRVNKIFSVKTEALGIGQLLLGRYRFSKNRCLPLGSLRRTLYDGFLKKISKAMRIYPRPLGETILSKYRQIEYSIFTRDTRCRRICARFLKGVKESIRKRIHTTSGHTLNTISLQSALQQSLSDHEITPNLKPSVAFIIPSQYLAGGTMVICQHANKLIRKGYNVMLFDNNLGEQPFKLDWFSGLLPKVIPMNKILIDCYIDIVIATHWSTAYTVRDFPAQRKLYFVQSDETRFHPPGSAETELARQTYTFDFECVVIARWLQKWLKSNFGKEAHYVPNGVDNSVFYLDEPLEPKNDRLRVLLEGQIDVPFKGMKEAFQVVDGMDCEVWCVSSSGRPKRNWHCDRFFENVPVQEMRRIYSSCDVLIKMSKVEGCFMPPLEMMACGGTVITNKVSGYDEYITDGYNGLVVEQGDVLAAKEKLNQLIKDRTLLEKLIQGGQETVKNYLTWEESSKRLEEVLTNQI